MKPFWKQNWQLKLKSSNNETLKNKSVKNLKQQGQTPEKVNVYAILNDLLFFTQCAKSFYFLNLFFSAFLCST